jgi:hypothetical protein
VADVVGTAILKIVTDMTGFAVDDVSKQLKGLGGISKESFASIQKGAALAGGAVVALAGGVIALGLRGAEVGDVQRNFDGLSQSMGESADTMLGALRQGTVGAIADFDLMKAANTAMGAGLKVNATEMGTLAGGARELAKRVGGDTTQAFDTLTKAIATGRTTSLASLGLFIDKEQAVAKYAASLGTSTSALTKSQEQMAVQNATLAALGDVLAAAGPQTADFGEEMAGLRVRVTNFTDSLGVAINDSPVVATLMRGIGSAMESAFGGDKAAMVQTLTGWVNYFAIGLTYGADAVVFLAARGDEALTLLKVVIAGVSATVLSMVEGMVGAITGMVGAAEKIPGIGEKFAGAHAALENTRLIIQGMRQDYQAQIGEALDGSARHKAALDAVSLTIAQTRTEMRAAAAAQDIVNASTAAYIPTSAATSQAAAEWAEKQKNFLAEVSKATVDFFSLQKFSQDEGIASYTRMTEEKNRLDRDYRALQNSIAEERMRQEALLYQSVEDKARSAGFVTRQQMQETAEEAYALHAEMLESGLFTATELQKAWEAYELARQAAMGQTGQSFVERSESLVSSTEGLMNQLGAKYKAAAIAGAIISTYQAVAKSMASLPWPSNLISAAGALAAGMMNVNRIRSSDPGFAIGTPNLDFMDFGRARQIIAHDEEAIIPRGGGHRLANEIAASLSRMPGYGVSQARAAALPAPVQLYIGIDPQSGRMRHLGADERGQVQQWLNSGELQVPQRSVVGRVG